MPSPAIAFTHGTGLEDVELNGKRQTEHRCAQTDLTANSPCLARDRCVTALRHFHLFDLDKNRNIKILQNSYENNTQGIIERIRKGIQCIKYEYFAKT